MNDDFDEEAFDKSIENIVDEETADAQLYVNKNIKPDMLTDQNSVGGINEVLDQDEDDGSESKGVNKKAVIIVICVIATIAVVGVVSYFVVKSALAKSKDNYAYYNSLGYEALDQKDYDKAIVNFEKALTYEEGQTNDKTNINMMLYMYDCYTEVGDTDKAEEILKEVINRDKVNKSAYYYLIEMYADRKDYQAIHDLYLSAKETGDSELILYFNNYLAQVPSVSPAGDTYQADQELTLSAPDGYKIYYTVDGSDPTKSASLYSGKIQITEGDTTLKFYAVNQYGFESDVVEADYKVVYTGPVKPTITPSNTEITQSDKVKVIISGTPSGAKVYYTTDGSNATTTSTVYTGPFELPEGRTTVSVLVVDTHGKTASASKSYNIKYTSKYTDAEAADFIWKALMEKKYVDDKHLDTEGRLCDLNYYSVKQVDDKKVYLFYYSIGGAMQDFWYGADGDSGDVYKVTGNDSNYVLTPIE